MSSSSAPHHLVANRYAVVTTLGRGGAGDVMAAWDQLTGRPVAVKCLAGASLADRQRLLRERELLESLVHPNIVRLLDAGVDREVPFLVMELIDGTSLAARLAGGPLGPAEVRRVGAGVAAALAFAHERGVVHRDVKPQNVLVDENGEPHLVDFGIARLVDAAAITATGEVMGTPAYLSPEQLTGEEVTGASDVYSLGLVLIEAASGDRLFDGAPFEAAVARLAQRVVRPQGVPDRLGTLLERMTDLDPSRRPSAAAVQRELEHLDLPMAGRGAAAATIVTQPMSAQTMALPASDAGRWRAAAPLVASRLADTRSEATGGRIDRGAIPAYGAAAGVLLLLILLGLWMTGGGDRAQAGDPPPALVPAPAAPQPAAPDPVPPARDGDDEGDDDGEEDDHDDGQGDEKDEREGGGGGRGGARGRG